MAQANTQIGLPVIFVHGICDGPDSFLPAEQAVKAYLQNRYASLYISPLEYVAFYDGTSVKFQVPISEQSSEIPNTPLDRIDPATRFFLVALSDNNRSSYPFDANVVANRPIYVKGNELGHIIWKIKTTTGAPRVLVVGHSMGGLDARAYIEGLAGPTGSANAVIPYFNDIAALVTLDTPHGGAYVGALDFAGVIFNGVACQANPSIDKSEMFPSGIDLLTQTNSIIPQLNYYASGAKPLPPALTINSIASSWIINTPLFLPLPGLGTDNVLGTQTQDLMANINSPEVNSQSDLNSIPNYFDELGLLIVPCGVTSQLHLLSCIGSASQTFSLIEKAILPSTIVNSGQVQIDSAISTVAPGNTVSFTSPGSSVIWSIREGADGGGITPEGVYTAPANHSSSIETFHIIAINSQNPSQYGEAAVQVTSSTNKTPTTTVLTSSSTQATQGASVAITATVLSDAARPTGTIAFYDGTNALSSALIINNAGVATFSTAMLSLGPHSITAKYGGDANFSGSTSPPITVTVTGISPVISVAPPTGTIGATQFQKTGTGFTPNGTITQRVTYPNGAANIVSRVVDSTGSYSYPITYSNQTGPYQQTDTDNASGQSSNTILWTVSTPSVNDFSLKPTLPSLTVSQSASVGFNIETATTSGLAQSISFSVSNVPTGLSASFDPASVTSGTGSTLTVSASSTASAGTYTLTVTGSGTTATHAVPVSVTVVQSVSGPIVTLQSNVVRFPNQSVGSIGSPQTVSLRNTGGGQLTINYIALAAGSDYVLTFLSPIPPILNPLVPFSFQVAFEPITTGTRSGWILIYDNAPDSPQAVTLTGTGAAAQPSTGTINVTANLNGAPIPAFYSYDYSLSGPASYTGHTSYSFAVTPGAYTVAFSGFPSYLTLASVSPAATEMVAAGGTTTFTLNFTAPNDFFGPSFRTGAQIVPAGGTANYTVGIGAPPGNAASVSLLVLGNPPGTNPTFNPEPALSTANSTLTVSTSATTPVGVYALSLSGTNSSGLIHSGDTSSLLITAPPSVPVQLVSESTVGAQANADATFASNRAVSADGRLVVFSSRATNLSNSIADGQTHVYARDTKSGSTTLVDVTNDATAANFGSSNPTISADGRYVAFISSSNNLPSPPTSGSFAIYERDLQLGKTERVDLSSNGTPANGSSPSGPSVSADGRFVAFTSDANNLAPGIAVTSKQIYARDRSSGKVVLVSVGTDGSSANQDALLPSMSADGRFVAFYSRASNLVSQVTSGGAEVFVRDLQLGQTVLASVANDGSPANASASDNSAPAISADGRYLAFSSNATNLVSGATNASNFRVFLRDAQSQTTTLVDTDALGKPLALGGTEPSISADGRFVAYKIYNQTLVRDMTSGHSVVVSIANDGNAGNNTLTDSAPPSISFGGTAIVFDSSATNLVANDTNNATDIFLAQNPLLGTPYVTSITLNSSPVGGGSSVAGTISLSGAAPAGGASVAISSNNIAAQVPALVVVPAGATGAPITFSTGSVQNETVMTILASYNGGSAAALLTLEPAGELAVDPSSWDFGYQPVGSVSTAKVFTIGNSGTGPLTINSVQLSNGLSFKIGPNTCGSSIDHGGSCSVSVMFNPTAAGLASDALQIGYGTAMFRTISLTGNGATPLATLSPATLNLGSQQMPGSNTAIATLTNGGNAPLSNIAAGVSGANASDFTITADNCSGETLPANSSCLITVAFSAKAAGTRTANLSVADSDSRGPQTISLTGTGVQSIPTVLWTPSVASFTYGTALGSGVLNATASANGNNLAGTFDYTATINGGAPQVVTSATVLEAGAYRLTATFAPADTTDYTTATATTSVTVNRATPTINWSNPEPIAYGASLNVSQLNATASVPGVFAYLPVAGTILSAGTHSLSVTFSPTDTTNYTSATVSSTVVVNPGPLTVTASNVSRLYGTANPTFTGSASGAVNGDTFTVSGTTNATISSDVGKYVIVPSAAGANINDYTVSLVSGTLTVAQAGSAVTLSSSNTSANLTVPATFTAMVSSATTGVPTGTVNFFDGQTALGAGTVNAQGSATYTSSSLTAGLHSITATYAGNTDFTASTSSALAETIVAPDYSATVNPTSLTIKQGDSGTAVFTITPVGGFNQTVQFGCSGLPINARCTFSPTTVTPSGIAVTSTLTIATNVQASSLTVPRNTFRPSLAISFAPAGFTCVLGIFVISRRKLSAQRRGFTRVFVAVTALTMGIAAVSCGGGNMTTTNTSNNGGGTTPPPLITPPGTTMVMVTASTTASAGSPHSASLTVTITN